jgi:hypothetical protein
MKEITLAFNDEKPFLKLFPNFDASSDIIEIRQENEFDKTKVIWLRTGKNNQTEMDWLYLADAIEASKG